MAEWMKTQQLPDQALQQIHAIYGDNFPIEVRHFLSNWIDRQSWTSINPDNHFHEQAIKDLLLRFIREIEEKAKSFHETNLFVTKLKFTRTAEEYKKRFEIDAVGLYRHIRNCLLSEMNVFQQNASTQNPPMMDCKGQSYSYRNNPQYTSINQQIESLRQQTQEVVDIGENLRAEREQIQVQYTKFHELERLIASQQSVNGELRMQQMVVGEPADHRFLLSKIENQKRQVEFEIREKINRLKKLLILLIEKMKEKSDIVRAMISLVLDNELIAWKRRQQLAGNGCDFDTNHLDVIQSWCEAIAEVISVCLDKSKDALKIIRDTITPSNNDMVIIVNNLCELTKKFTEHITTIVLNTFILEKQPPQVMKTNTRFSAKIRFLIGSKLNIYLNPPQVKVSIISEAQANLLLSEKQMRGEASGEILNNVGTMEYDHTTKQLSIQFRNMQLKKIKRAEKKGSESVVDEKFSLFFSSKFSIGPDLDFGVWTMSLPVTVIVHGNQEPHAWATITWDNAFADAGRRPFVVPEKVTWGKVANALNLKFNAVTGRPLSLDNIKYLAEKLFRLPYPCDDYDTMQVSWSQFSKESLVDRSFTFWDWFYAIMKLTKEHLKPLWTDGHILGFLRKQEAESMLSTCPLGTFLLRFSDSEMGGITIAWVGGTEEQKQVTMLQPFTAKDFAIRSLADRIFDLQHLMYLYPDTPKDTAFGRHYTPVTDSQTTSPNGYVKPLLVTTVPGVSWALPNHIDHSGRMSGFNSYPTTPIIQPNSPSAHSTISEPVGVGGWPEPFTAMDYESINNITEFADFSALQDPPMTGVQSRLSDSH